MKSLSIRCCGTIALVLGMGSLAEAAAPGGRYTVGAGTVYDNKTKLTWQQVVPSTPSAWTSAKASCPGLGATLGGTGWRLPTVNELLSIVDYSVGQPSIDQAAFPSTPSDYFWSASPAVGDPASAWAVTFTTGGASKQASSTPYYVRCVR
jgi:Protein of unknown function (DUF1566)